MITPASNPSSLSCGDVLVGFASPEVHITPPHSPRRTYLLSTLTAHRNAELQHTTQLPPPPATPTSQPHPQPCLQPPPHADVIQEIEETIKSRDDFADQFEKDVFQKKNNLRRTVETVKTCYFVTGHEVYELPCGMTRNRATAKVVMSRLMHLTEAREAAGRRRAEAMLLMRQKRQEAALAPATEDITTTTTTAAPPKAATSLSPRDVVRMQLDEKEQTQRRLHAATTTIGTLRSRRRAANAVLLCSTLRNKEVLERQEEERQTAALLPADERRVLLRRLCLWRSVLCFVTFATTAHRCYVTQKAANLVKTRQQLTLCSAQKNLFAKVLKTRILKAKRATGLISKGISPLLGLQGKVRHLSQSTDIVLKCIQSRLALGLLGFRIKQFSSKIYGVQRFFRKWIQGRRICLIALGLVQFNITEVRLMRCSNVSRTDERLQLVGDVKKDGRDKHSSFSSACDGPEKEEKEKTVRYRRQIGIPPPQAAVVSGHQTKVRGKAYAFASPHVSYLVKRRLVENEVNRVMEERAREYRVWVESQDSSATLKRTEQYRAEQAQRLLSGEEDVQLRVADASRPPLLPFCLNYERVEAMVKESFQVQAKTELTWQAALPRAKFKTLSETLREVKAKALHLYYKGKERETEFLSTVAPGLANYVLANQ